MVLKEQAISSVSHTMSSNSTDAEPSPVLWKPSKSLVDSCELTKFSEFINERHHAGVSKGDYDKIHRWSVEYPNLFWSSFISFLKIPISSLSDDQILKHGSPRAGMPSLIDVTWFKGGLMNYTESVLRFATISPGSTAILFRPESSTIFPQRLSFSYKQLQKGVLKISRGLRELGIRKGDSIAAIASNTPQAVVAMLATLAIGAVWSSCSPDFGPSAIVSRLSQTTPKALFYSPSYVYKSRRHNISGNLVHVLAQVKSIRHVISITDMAEDDGDVTFKQLSTTHYMYKFSEFGSESSDGFQRISMSDPIFTMFSSGTSGPPKCLAQGNGVLINQLKEHTLHLNISKDSVVLFNTSTGWMMFTWLVAVLGTGATIVLYDGAAIPPEDPFRLLTIAKEEKVTHFGCGAKYLECIQALEKSIENPHRLPNLKMLMATGSPSTPKVFDFCSSYFGSHVQYVSMSGGTEINGCFALGVPWKPVRSPELQCASLGMRVAVLDRAGREVVGEYGELVCLNPCPCMPLYFLNDSDHSRYRGSYFEKFGANVWSHGDFAMKTKSGGFVIAGRSDSALNRGGVRIGTAEIYDVVERIPFVMDSLVVEHSDSTDTRIIMLLTMERDVTLDETKKHDVKRLLRYQLSPRHVPDVLFQVSELPYTFSGKKCELLVKGMLQTGLKPSSLAIKNPGSLHEILSQFEKESMGLTSL